MYGADFSLSELQELLENQGIDVIVRSYDISMSNGPYEQFSIDISVDCAGMLRKEDVGDVEESYTPEEAYNRAMEFLNQNAKTT